MDSEIPSSQSNSYYGARRRNREVPLSAQIGCLFGGFLAQFGWLFAAFGMIFVLVFFRQENFEPGVVFVAIFPIVGFCFAIPRLFKGKKNIRLLKIGRIVIGEVVDKKRTNMEINEEPVYEMTYEFSSQDGRKSQVKVRSHLAENVHRGFQSRVIYDPANLNHAHVLEFMPGGHEVTQTHVEPKNRNYLLLILPTITLLEIVSPLVL